MTEHPTFGWPEHAETQKLWITVKEWDYKLFFESLRHGHRTTFQWEGVILKPEAGFRGVKVMAGFEIPVELLDVDEDNDDPRLSKCGTLCVVAEGLLGLYLLVTPAAYDDLLRLFAAVFATGERGVISVDVTVASKKAVEPTFWQAGWRSERLDVLRFDIHAGSLLKDRRTLLQRLGGSS